MTRDKNNSHTLENILSSHTKIEELRHFCSPEIYRESLESMFEAWLLSANLPEGSERDTIYFNYKFLMEFLKEI